MIFDNISEEIAKLRDDVTNAKKRLDYATEDDEIDACIFELRAAEIRVNMVIREAKKMTA
jgi:hypothetical protein